VCDSDYTTPQGSDMKIELSREEVKEIIIDAVKTKWPMPEREYVIELDYMLRDVTIDVSPPKANEPEEK
jgi:hypothetical protein